MNISENITNLRKEKNLTQEELAKLINVSPKTISSYETNRSLPNIETLIDLTEALNTDINTLLGLNNTNKSAYTKAYKQKELKENILKIIIIGLILIVPIIFFWYAGYVSIAALIVKIVTVNGDNLTENARFALNLYTSFSIEYLIYLLIMLLNYILYKKRLKTPLLIINIFIFILISFSLLSNGIFVNIDLLIFIFATIVGIAESLILFKTTKKRS